MTLLEMRRPNLYRTEALPVPSRLRHRPVERGYPVPWFVALVNGAYDFRVMDADKLIDAIRNRRCWICGESLMRNVVFTVGPMCAINRTSGEPPAHKECAEYSARVCPFLTQREAHRREGNLPEDAHPGGGISIPRQPGVTLLWGTRSYAVQRTETGPIVKLGDPEWVRWLSHGREATRAEVLASIESGYPALLDLAASDPNDPPGALRELSRRRKAIEPLLPPPTPSREVPQ